MTTTEQTSDTIAYRTCPLCEAGCGLEITLAPPNSDRTVIRIRGDRDDVFSNGFICPKGSTLGHLHDDPDRLRKPVVKRDGHFVEVDWDEAFATIEDALMPLLETHGRDSCAIYLGNPSAHSLGPLLYNRTLITSLGTRNRFSASTVDQRPKELSAAMMFGSVTVPVPDLDRTDFLVMLGANPYASNGSLCTAPDFPGRLERIQARGGTVVCVDPRRSETADRADQHIAIRPGTDAHLLAAVANTLLTDDLARPGRLAAHTDGLEDLGAALTRYTPEAVAGVCGVDPDTIRRLAHELAAAPTAAVYGRIGTCTQEFGTLASWLVDIVNLLSGNLDRVGGAMFTTGAAGQPSTKGEPGRGRGVKTGRVVSRVGHRPESFGEFPVTALPEEIETPGEGQVRALDHRRRQPGVVQPQRRARRRRAGIARVHGVGRSLHQRDDPPRRRDPATPVCAAEVALRPGTAQLRRAKRRQLLARGAPARRGSALRVGDHAAAVGGGRRRRTRRRPHGDRRLDRSGRCCVGRTRRARPGARPQTSTSCWRWWAIGSGPSGCSTSCCAPDRSVMASDPTRMGCRWTSSRPTRTGSTSVHFGRTGSPTCCARPPARSRRSPPR